MELLAARSANNFNRRLALADGRRPRTIPAGSLVYFPSPEHTAPLTESEEAFIGEYVACRVLVQPTEENKRIIADALKRSPDGLYWVLSRPDGGFAIQFPPQPQAD